MLQAPIIGVLIRTVFGKRASESVTAENFAKVSSATATSVFLLVLSAIWFGCSKWVAASWTRNSSSL